MAVVVRVAVDEATFEAKGEFPKDRIPNATEMSIEFGHHLEILGDSLR